MLKHRHLVASGTSLLALAFASPVMAQVAAGAGPAGSVSETATAPAPVDTTQDAGVADIVVTAERRESRLQQTPIAVTVAGAAALRNANITDVQNLKLIAPGVDVQANNGYAAPLIRGVGTKANGPGVETPVAVYVDGVYYAAPISTLFTFNNIAQVEILKGPQGTLFGRNSTGGLLQIRTRDPSQNAGGELNVQYGNYQTLRGDGYLTAGITSNLAADIAFQVTSMGKGYGTNLFNGQDVYKVDHEYSLRSKWLWTAGERTEIRVIGDYTDTKNSMAAQRVPSTAVVPPPYAPSYGGGDWDTSLNTQPLIRLKQGGASLRIDHDLDTVRIASITAYRESRFVNDFDFDFTPIFGRAVRINQKDDQFSQELQLLSAGNGPLNWAAGAYYFNANSRYDPIQFFYNGVGRLPNGNILNTVTSNQKTDSISGFGQATYAVTPQLKLTGGLRYTSEKRELPGNAFQTSPTGAVLVTVPQRTLERRFNKLTWRAALSYEFTPDAMAYASYNRGFKSGGFNPSGLTLPAFEPEVLDAYEIGIKTSMLDRRLRFNVAGYYYDYQNVQVQRIVDGANGVFNGAKAEIYGADVDLAFQVTPEFLLASAYTYTHGEYKAFPGSVVARRLPQGYFSMGVGDVAGNRTVLTPKHSFNVSGTYTVDLGQGSLVANATYYYNSGFYQEPDNVLFEKAYNLVGASLRYRFDSGFSVGVYGNNLTNNRVSNFSGIANIGGGLGVQRRSLQPPRTYGVTAGMKF